MALKMDYTGDTVLVYSPNNTYLYESVVTFHDKKKHRVELHRGMHSSLNVDDICTLLFMNTPSPSEFKGRVVKEGLQYYFLLFRGKAKEDRKTTRFAAKFNANIEELIFDGEKFPLLNPITVTTINISKTGVRFAAPQNTLLNGDAFTLRLKIDKSDRLFNAAVINYRNTNADTTEYGCSFGVK
jgi:hypothetical protein